LRGASAGSGGSFAGTAAEALVELPGLPRRLLVLHDHDADDGLARVRALVVEVAQAPGAEGVVGVALLVRLGEVLELLAVALLGRGLEEIAAAALFEPADLVDGLGDPGVGLRDGRGLLGGGQFEDGRGLRISAAAVDGRLVEEGEEAEVVALGDGVELVVVAARAGEGESEPDGADGLGHVEDVLDAVLLGDAAAFAVDRVVAEEGGGERMPGLGEQVARDLPDRELVPGEVLVEGPDHPVAPGPHGAFAVALVAVGIGVAGGFHPVPGHAFAEAGGGEEAVDELPVRVGRAVGEEGVGLLDRGGQAREVERGAPEKRRAVGLRRRPELLALQAGANEGVDGMPRGGRRRLDEGAERPVLAPGRARVEPFLQGLDLRLGELLVGLGGGHEVVGVLGDDPPIELALGALPGDDGGAALVILLPGLEFVVEPEVGLALLGVGSVAGEAGVGEDGEDVAVEVDAGVLVRSRAGQEEGGEAGAQGHGLFVLPVRRG
jgi:hypothetical protein